MEIIIKYALHAEHDSNWYEVKSKNEYALWLIKSGSLQIKYKEQSYILNQGELFLFYPDTLYHASSNEGCTFTFIHFDAIIGRNYHALHFYPFYGKYSSKVISPYFNVLLESAKSFQQHHTFSDMEIQGATMLFLSNLMRERYSEEKSNHLVSSKSTLARLQPVLVYINHHISEAIYVKELAETINLSEKYFISFFTKAMGVTPTHYVIQVKMKKALEYLNEQSYSVKEVASMTGYSDIYVFSKAFKKIYGVSPSKI